MTHLGLSGGAGHSSLFMVSGARCRLLVVVLSACRFCVWWWWLLSPSVGSGGGPLLLFVGGGGRQSLLLHGTWVQCHRKGWGDETMLTHLG